MKAKFDTKEFWEDNYFSLLSDYDFLRAYIQDYLMSSGEERQILERQIKEIIAI